MTSIALIHHSAPPVVGGVESVMGHHARLMANAGHSVRLVAARGEAVDPRVAFERLPLIDSRHGEVDVVNAELDRRQGREKFTLPDHVRLMLN